MRFSSKNIATNFNGWCSGHCAVVVDFYRAWLLHMREVTLEMLRVEIRLEGAIVAGLKVLVCLP